jgi:hypothetical protein
VLAFEGVITGSDASDFRASWLLKNSPYSLEALLAMERSEIDGGHSWIGDRIADLKTRPKPLPFDDILDQGKFMAADVDAPKGGASGVQLDERPFVFDPDMSAECMLDGGAGDRSEDLEICACVWRSDPHDIADDDPILRSMGIAGRSFACANGERRDCAGFESSAAFRQRGRPEGPRTGFRADHDLSINVPSRDTSFVANLGHIGYYHLHVCHFSSRMRSELL